MVLDGLPHITGSFALAQDEGLKLLHLVEAGKNAAPGDGDAITTTHPLTPLLSGREDYADQTRFPRPAQIIAH